VHAGVDWDWQVPAVTLAALVCAAVLLGASPAAVRVGRRSRGGVVAVTLALTCFAFVSLVGNIELSRAANAARAGDWSRSAAHARRARTWEPWSPQPWQLLGVAQLATGDATSAQASLRKAIAKDGNDWELWFDLARATTGAPQTAALARAAKLNPRSPEIAELRKEIAGQ
jgi:Flp pilus assembly protein TadD